MIFFTYGDSSVWESEALFLDILGEFRLIYRYVSSVFARVLLNNSFSHYHFLLHIEIFSGK